MIITKKSYQERKALFEILKDDIEPIKIPRLLETYLQILVRYPHENLLKFYLYYLLPKYKYS